MKPSDIVPEFLRIATLVRHDPPGWQEEYAACIAEFSHADLGDLLIVAIGALEADYPDDGEWQEVCLAAAGRAEEFRAEGM